MCPTDRRRLGPTGSVLDRRQQVSVAGGGGSGVDDDRADLVDGEVEDLPEWR